MAEEKKAATKKDEKTKDVSENIRCRVCRVVDGYNRNAQKCRFCGAKLFRGDVV